MKSVKGGRIIMGDRSGMRTGTVADKHYMRALIIVLCIFTLTGSCLARHFEIRCGPAMDEVVPEPRLIAPKTDAVDLAGKAELEFKWSPHESARGFRRYYDFRLYKGTSTLESTLIYKEQVPPDVCQKKMPSNIFEEGQVYTWTLRQVYDGARKSRRSYKVFKIIKIQP